MVQAKSVFVTVPRVLTRTFIPFSRVKCVMYVHRDIVVQMFCVTADFPSSTLSAAEDGLFLSSTLSSAEDGTLCP